MYINQAFMDGRSPIELQFMCTCIDKLIYDKVTTEVTNYGNLKDTVCDCPHCHSKNYKKNGFNPKHKQKYRCKDCGAGFIATTGTFFSHSPAKFLTRVELDATYTKINLKGTRKEDMPRISKKRGKHKTSLVSKELAGISHPKVCIITAIDEHDNIPYRF